MDTLIDTADGLLGAAAYAERAGVSEQTVRNWVRKGVIPAASRRPLRIDPATADTALAAHRRANGHGGRRPGSGRPPGTKNPAPARPDAPPTPIEARAAVARRAAEGTTPADAVRLAEILNVTHDELVALVHFADEAGLTQQGLDRLKSIEDIRRRRRENMIAEGRLVDADAARAAMTDAHQRVKGRLEGLGRRVAAAVADIAWVAPETVDEIADLVRAAGGDGDTERAARDLLARPDDLAAAVAAAIENEVRAAMRAIAEREKP